MKKNLFKLSLVFVFFCLFWGVPLAKADGPVTVHLRIKTNNISLYDANIIVTACPEADGSATSTVNVRCAVDQTGLTDPSDWTYSGAFLNSIKGAYASDYVNNIYWGWFSNLEYGQVSMTQHILTNGEKLLLVYNTNPLKISVDNTTPYVNATSTITVKQFGLDVNWMPVWTPAASSTLVISGTEVFNESGVYKYTPSVSGEKTIYGKKGGYVNSYDLIVIAQNLATSTVHLQIKTNDISLYDANIIVTACPEADGSATSTVNVRCAVDQTGLTDPSDWTYGGTFLNSIKGAYASDYVNNIYWGWFSNLKYGEVSMAQHILTNNEKLLLVYNTNPLKISVDNTTPYVNATSTITVKQFGLDVNWMPVWTPAASSTLVISGTEVFNESGVYKYTPSVSGEKTIYGKKGGYVNSYDITINGQDVQVNIEPTVNISQPGGSVIIPSSSGSSPVTTAPKIDLSKAVDFLTNKQKPDGSFGAILQTDWAAIALASVNQNSSAAQKVKAYLLTDPNSSVGMNQVSDYARRAMALMSLNVNPYNGVKTDYVKKIIDLFDGRQFGDATLYNDDIFTLLVLNKAGYGADEEIIKQVALFIISKQQTNGSWSGVDLTAAAIQALTPLSALTGVATALEKAKSFLAGAQKADGGFGDTYATSWVMQAITALGENSGNWQKNNNTPESYLVLSQGADGGLEKNNLYEINRIWSTSYAIPAILGRPWFNILSGFTKENTAVIKNEPAGNSLPGPDLIATSTPEKSDLATSSPAIARQALDQASTTAVSLTAEADNNKNKDIIKPAKPDIKTIINLPAKPKKPLPPPVLRPKIEPPKALNINNQANQTEKIVQAASSRADSLTPEVKGAEEKPAESNKINNKAKKVLYIAGAGTVLAGIVLILKFLGFLL